jgi:adenylylsulfate kinase-like enzyme
MDEKGTYPLPIAIKCVMLFNGLSLSGAATIADRLLDALDQGQKAVF